MLAVFHTLKMLLGFSDSNIMYSSLYRIVKGKHFWFAPFCISFVAFLRSFYGYYLGYRKF